MRPIRCRVWRILGLASGLPRADFPAMHSVDKSTHYCLWRKVFAHIALVYLLLNDTHRGRDFTSIKTGFVIVRNRFMNKSLTRAYSTLSGGGRCLKYILTLNLLHTF